MVPLCVSRREHESVQLVRAASGKERLVTLLTHFSTLSQRTHQSVVDSMQNMAVWDFQFRMLDKEGNAIFVHGKSKPEMVTEVHGEETITLTKWSGVLFDITEQEKHNQAHLA